MMKILLILTICFAFADSLVLYNDPGTLDIGAFNVQVFGRSKMKKSLVRKILPQIVRKYDLLLIQEIRDASGRAIKELLRLVNGDKTKNRYKVLISPRLGRTYSKEEYAYIYREDLLTVVDDYTYEDAADVFEREPFIARFDTNGFASIKEFAVIGIHTSPTDASNEINNLVNVYDDVRKKWKINDVIIMGDLNADCTYVSKWKDISLATDNRFYWLLDDTSDTTTKNTECTYDRMVVAGKKLLRSIIPTSPSVLHFEEIFHLTQKQAIQISDHFPVQMQIRSKSEMNTIKYSTGFIIQETKVDDYLEGSPAKAHALNRLVKTKLSPSWKYSASYTKSGAYLEINVCKNTNSIQRALESIKELMNGLPDFFPPTAMNVAQRLLRSTNGLNSLSRGYGRYQTLYNFYKSATQIYFICLKCNLRDRDRPSCNVHIMNKMENINFIA